MPIEKRLLEREDRGAFHFFELQPIGRNVEFPGAGLHVVHLGKFYPPASGGIETHLQSLARSQAKLGADVRVICVNHADRTGRDVTWSKFRSTPTVDEVDGVVRVTRLGRIASFARLDLCPDLLGELRRIASTNADILHLHTPNPTMLLAVAVVAPRVPLVVTHHSDVVKQRFLRYLVHPFESRVYRNARRLLATSPEYSAGSPPLKRHLSKVTDLPLGIDLDPYLHPSAQALAHAAYLKKKHGDILWLAVGRLIYYKGLDVALRALPLVPGKLLVIGTGPLHDELRLQAKSLNIEDRVVWLGNTDSVELIGAYLAATALWFPSNARSEGFGLVQVEAMATGCPVINTAVPSSGVAWVSRDGESGLTVPINDHVAFASATRRLVEEPKLRPRLSAGAVERANRDFGQEKMASRSLDFYFEAIECNP